MAVKRRERERVIMKLVLILNVVPVGYCGVVDDEIIVVRLCGRSVML